VTAPRYNVIEETDDGDLILHAGLGLFDAECKLCDAINGGADAYLTDYKPGDKGVND
jgi:hypothetical protein